jgi:hypothetical protein
MEAAIHDFQMDQGSDEAFEVTIADFDDATEIATPWDLAPYQVRGHIRSSEREDAPLVGELVCAITDAALGEISVTIPNAVSSALDASLIHHYDVEIYTPGDVVKLKVIRGKIDLTQSQTRT